MFHGLRVSRALFSVGTFLVLVLSIIVFSDYNAVAKTEVAIRGSKVLLTEGEAMKATLKIEKPTAIDEVSFSARRVGSSDPFASSQIPFTIEVYESDQLVASESFTQTLDDKFEKIIVSINNIPKMDEKYKMLIRYDIPEDNGQSNNPIQIDAGSIEVNEGEDGIEVHGKIRIVF